MNNTITEGKDRELLPDRHGEILRVPTPAAIELKTEILQASAHKEAGQGDAMRERSSIESRTDLRLAATNEVMRGESARSTATLVVEQDTARRWADLDANDFGRIRSNSRRENALEAIAGHMRVSPEYTDELKKRSPSLAVAGARLNAERATIERASGDREVQNRIEGDIHARHNRATMDVEGMNIEPRTLAPVITIELARQDVEDYRKLDRIDNVLGAALAIGQMMQNTSYHQEVERLSPDVALRAKVLFDHEKSFAKTIEQEPSVREAVERGDRRAEFAGRSVSSDRYQNEQRAIAAMPESALRAYSEKMEREIALPTIERNSAALAYQGEARTVLDVEQRELAQQDAKSLAAIPDGSERHLAAAVIGESARNHTSYREELQQIAPQLAREAAAAAIERDGVRAVERRNSELMVVPRDAMSVAEAREAVRQDVASISTIKDEFARYQAAVSIGDNARNQASYRAELQIQAPVVAKEAQVASTENDRRITEKENRKAAEFALMQLAKAERASSWTPEQAVDQARKDVASLRTVDADERHYAIGDMAIAVERSKAYGETLSKEAPVAAREVEARREYDDAQRAAAEQRKDNISAAAQSRAALIDAAALAAVAKVRARETARVVEQLASSPDTATQQLRDAQQALKAPPLDGRVTAPDDPDIAAQRARAIKRPVAEEELSQALLTRFIVSHEKRGLLDKGSTEFTFRNGDEQGRVAFVDAGKALSTERNDKATIRAMIEVATTKNWKEITVSGADDFRRNAWLDANLSGIKVRGYEPREADKQILADLLERNKPANVITAVELEHKRDQPRESPRPPAERAPQRKHIDGDALTAHEKTVLDNSRAILDSKTLGDQFTQAALHELESKLRGERIYVGEIVDHGRAPYQFDKENDDSYYVTLKTRAGEQVIWGKGLAEAMKERSAGEQVVLQNIGKRDVTVQERVRDAQGHVVGTRSKESQLNAWKSELLSRFSEKARTDFASRSATRQPSFGVYDAKATRAPVQPAVPARTPDQQRRAEQERNSRER